LGSCEKGDMPVTSTNSSWTGKKKHSRHFTTGFSGCLKEKCWVGVCHIAEARAKCWV